ncbi:hypothetical protein T4D_12011 [Trichinella pseudospiralis]|uniref:Uncharacterized protein n=1 Tax=Trichinella pseudospiralis TaxID=6337 RepID=A0A0V1F2Q8_TRIPS|nr:hypothetical protein T4D_12011 [Trichinella pseudospiralis]
MRLKHGGQCSDRSLLELLSTDDGKATATITKLHDFVLHLSSVLEL